MKTFTREKIVDFFKVQPRRSKREMSSLVNEIERLNNWEELLRIKIDISELDQLYTKEKDPIRKVQNRIDWSKVWNKLNRYNTEYRKMDIQDVYGAYLELSDWITEELDTNRSDMETTYKDYYDKF
jgi:hypothetical protein